MISSRARKARALVIALMALAVLAQPRAARAEDLSAKLNTLRSKVMVLQQNLLDALKTEKEARTNVKKIQALLKLQREERDLGKRRLVELERTVQELESRRATLVERARAEQKAVRKFLSSLGLALQAEDDGADLTEARLAIESPRRKTLANLADRSFKEVEALKVDLSDAEQLEKRIQDEKQQLAYLFQDLNEQEGVLELNRQLQSDLLKRNQRERVAQLENYRRLKSSEAQVEKLIGDFTARVELEKLNELEHQRAQRAAPAPAEAVAAAKVIFSSLKGRLHLPVEGKVVSQFGRLYDPNSRLYIFKKGIDIAPGEGGKKLPVRAVSRGRVAYSGELPDYGRVAIVDHGDHFYTLCAHLGSLSRKAGEEVSAGDEIGSTADTGAPVYFEIRSRNVAVNPLQWLSN